MSRVFGNGIFNDEPGELDSRGLVSFFDKSKEDLQAINVLNEILKDIAKFQIADLKKGSIFDVTKRGDTVEKLLTKVFVSLKKSGLLLPIIKMTLTEYKTREATVKLIVELLEADIIPYEEIFEALNESGIVLLVTKFSLTDEETREGLGKLILQILPVLLKTNDVDSNVVIEMATAAQIEQVGNSTISNLL